MRKKPLIAASVVLVLLVGFRLYLPTLAKHHINRLLNRDPLYHGEVKDVEISLWRGAYTLIGLSIERVEGQKDYPLISAGNIDIGVNWRDLLRRSVLAKIKIEDLVVNIVQERKQNEKKVAIGRETKEGKKQEAQDWKKTVRALVPIDVSRLLVRGKSIHFRDLTSSPKVDVYLDHLEIDARNLTNSSKISKSLFGRIDLKARAMQSGELHLVLNINPLVSPPQFKATTQLQDFDLTKMNDFFTAYGGFDVKGGSLALYSEVATANNNIKGYIKPIIKDLKVADLKKDSKKGVFHAAWEVLVGAIAGIFKNHKENQQATQIAFSGRLDNPETSTWDTVKTALYNAFVKPLSPKLDNSVKLAQVENKK